MVVDGDLLFGAEADTQGSGGFASGLRVTGQVNFTMQQQWILRNCELGDGISYWPGTAKKRILTFGRRATAEQRPPKTPEKQQQQEEHHKRAAREARRPLCDPFFFLLSLFFARFRGALFGRIPSSKS